MKWNLFHRKPKRTLEDQISIAGKEIVSTLLYQLRTEPPITVRHVVERRIPVPRNATLIATNGNGEQYRAWLDLSYKNSIRVSFPVAFFTGRDEDLAIPPMTLEMLLDYDPKERS